MNIPKIQDRIRGGADLSAQVTLLDQSYIRVYPQGFFDQHILPFIAPGGRTRTGYDLKLSGQGRSLANVIFNVALTSHRNQTIRIADLRIIDVRRGRPTRGVLVQQVPEGMSSTPQLVARLNTRSSSAFYSAGSRVSFPNANHTFGRIPFLSVIMSKSCSTSRWPPRRCLPHSA